MQPKGMIIMKFIIAAAAIIASLFTGVNLAVSTPLPAQARTEVILDHPVLHGAIAEAVGRPCRSEADDVNCFWNARTMGNGKGHSFYAVRMGHRVSIIYWNREYNRKHGFSYLIQ